MTAPETLLDRQRSAHGAACETLRNLRGAYNDAVRVLVHMRMDGASAAPDLAEARARMIDLRTAMEAAERRERTARHAVEAAERCAEAVTA